MHSPLLSNGLQIVLVLTICVLLWRGQVSARICWLLFVLAVGALTYGTFGTPQRATDARHFWQAGADLWNGRDPYARPPILHPPTALPLFQLFALLPQEQWVLVWQGFNVVGGILLIFLVQQILLHCPEYAQQQLPTAALALLGAAVFLSFAHRYGIFLGQLSVLVTLSVLAALWLQDRHHPLAAGAGLALASIKPTTMLPFLLLFLRKKDWPTWLALTVCGFGLALAAVPAPELPACLGRCLDNIRQALEPGHVNDYSFANDNNRELIAFDYALYHLGVRDRVQIPLIQLAVVMLLGVLVWHGRRYASRAGACALTACYAALFLYHRLYDMLILAVPLVYAVARTRSATGWVRFGYGVASMAILGVLYLRLSLLKELTALVRQPGPGPRLLEAVVLPYGIWLTLAALVSLLVAERWRDQGQRPRSGPPSTSRTTLPAAVPLPPGVRRDTMPVAGL